MAVIASFTFAKTSGSFIAPPFTITFTDTSTDSPTNWLWDFGDNSGISTDQHPVHEYNSAGPFNVTLTAWKETSSANVNGVKVSGTDVRQTPGLGNENAAWINFLSQPWVSAGLNFTAWVYGRSASNASYVAARTILTFDLSAHSASSSIATISYAIQGRAENASVNASIFKISTDVLQDLDIPAPSLISLTYVDYIVDRVDGHLGDSAFQIFIEDGFDNTQRIAANDPGTGLFRVGYRGRTNTMATITISTYSSIDSASQTIPEELFPSFIANPKKGFENINATFEIIDPSSGIESVLWQRNRSHIKEEAVDFNGTPASETPTENFNINSP